MLEHKDELLGVLREAVEDAGAAAGSPSDTDRGVAGVEVSWRNRELPIEVSAIPDSVTPGATTLTRMFCLPPYSWARMRPACTNADFGPEYAKLPGKAATPCIDESMTRAPGVP